jgi:hypothetical protein
MGANGDIAKPVVYGDVRTSYLEVLATVPIVRVLCVPSRYGRTQCQHVPLYTCILLYRRIQLSIRWWEPAGAPRAPSLSTCTRSSVKLQLWKAHAAQQPEWSTISERRDNDIGANVQVAALRKCSSTCKY